MPTARPPSVCAHYDGVPVVCHIILEHSENEKNSENVPNIL